MKKIIDFTKTYWHLLISTVIFGFVVILWYVNPNFHIWHYVMMLSLIVLCMIVDFFDKEAYRFNRKQSILSISLMLLILSVLWHFPINIYWSILLSTLFLMACFKSYFLPAIYIAGIGMICFISEQTYRNKNMTNHEMQKAVIEQITENTNGTYMINFKDQGTFFAPKDSNLDLLREGDTVMVLIRDDEILKLSRK